MAIPNDMEQVNIIIETDYVQAIVEYGRTDGRRLSKSAAARELIITALRLLSVKNRADAPHNEQVTA